MAIVVLSDTPNMTSEQYDKVAAEAGIRSALPDGCQTYIAGPGPDGSSWREISVWETPSQAREFMTTPSGQPWSARVPAPSGDHR